MSKKDPLQDLADIIRKSRAPSAETVPSAKAVPVRLAPMAPIAPPPRRQGFVKSVGAGGVVFDFGSSTGNAVADRMTWMLNRHGDPTQQALAKSQLIEHNHALAKYVVNGQDEQQRGEGVHDQWHSQLSKSFDQQVVNAIKSGELPVESTNAPRSNVQGNFNKSQVMLQTGEMAVAQSETDAAVVEMMKSMMEADKPEPGELISDATEGG